jgi:hypothetical protein
MQNKDNFFQRKGQKKQRVKNTRIIAPHRYLIVCEGKKTEPNYFEGISKKINDRFSNRIHVKNKIVFDIEGTGRNTLDLVNFTDKLVSQSAIPFGHVWVIFDKDDFTEHQFNGAIAFAEAKGYHAGWSNECIELWFLLHFEFTRNRISRYRYYERLDKYFKRYGINNGKYGKNIMDIYDILTKYGDPEAAIERATKLYKYFCDNGVYSPARMKPATTVYELVTELNEYI